MLAKLFENRSLDSVAEVLDYADRQRGVSNASGIAITPNSAFGHPSVWACVWLLSHSVSMLPIDFYRNVADGDTTVKRPVSTPSLFAKPNADIEIDAWVEQIMVSLLLRGNAYGLITSRDSQGSAKSIDILNPDLVTVRRERGRGWVYTVDKTEVSADSLLHIPGYLAPGSIVGLSPIGYAAQTIGLGIQAERFGAQFFADGGHPSALLKSDQRINKQQADEIKAKFVNATRDNREPAVLGSGLVYEAIQVAPNESQFLEAIGANDIRVSQFFGVPPEMIGVTPAHKSAVTYANREQRAIDFVTFSLAFWLKRLETGFNTLTPRGQYCKLNVDALIRADIQTRYAAHAISISNKFGTPNEARALEDLPPLTEDQKNELADANSGQAQPTDTGSALPAN